MENEISREVAEEEFERMRKYARARFNRVRNKNEKLDLDDLKESLIADIMEGKVIVDEKGSPSVLTESEDTPKITFTRKPWGAISGAMDREKAGQENKKMTAGISAATGVIMGRLEALEVSDFMILSNVFSIFMVH